MYGCFCFWKQCKRWIREIVDCRWRTNLECTKLVSIGDWIEIYLGCRVDSRDWVVKDKVLRIWEKLGDLKELINRSWKGY